ncbi:MAG: hypothetical protein IT576_04660 [Verrucomicrobiales bacterium]|nr:hypothetical protein [Verrucomicrobiales bacterium]
MLFKAKPLKAYQLDSLDGEPGMVREFSFDDRKWAIRDLLVLTRNWWPGKKVLETPECMERVSGGESKVFVKLTPDAIKASPKSSEDALITRKYESRLLRHFGRDGYWSHHTEHLTFA